MKEYIIAAYSWNISGNSMNIIKVSANSELNALKAYLPLYKNANSVQEIYDELNCRDNCIYVKALED